MAKRTPTTPPEQTADTPQPDPLLMKAQQLQQQLQQTNKQIMDIQQQERIMGDMKSSLHDQAQQIIGALNILKDIAEPTPPEQK